MISLIQPAGYNASTCGYCSPKGSRSATESSKSYGAFAHQLSCEDYQALIDRGWRRSGTYIYKPDMARTCCPQYTIRVGEEDFKPSKSQRHLVNKFATFVKGRSESEKNGNKSVKPNKGKGKEQNFDLCEAFASCEDYREGDAHALEISLEPASLTDEKFELYKRYQIEIHGDPPKKISRTSFDRFLCSGPLHYEESGCKEVPYGAYHQLYRLDGNLIAFGVLDILPQCVSSVYLVWDPAHAALGLGKVSAMREIALVRELRQKGIKDMRYLYMGFYIHSCQKMRYKAEYKPSFLLDPTSNVFYPFEVCKPRLDVSERANFATRHNDIALERTNATTVEDSGNDTELEEGIDHPHLPPNTPGRLLESEIDPDLLSHCSVVERRRVVPILSSNVWQKLGTRKISTDLIAALGRDVSKRAVLYIM